MIWINTKVCTIKSSISCRNRRAKICKCILKHLNIQLLFKLVPNLRSKWPIMGNRILQADKKKIRIKRTLKRIGFKHSKKQSIFFKSEKLSFIKLNTYCERVFEAVFMGHRILWKLRLPFGKSWDKCYCNCGVENIRVKISDDKSNAFWRPNKSKYGRYNCAKIN